MRKSHIYFLNGKKGTTTSSFLFTFIRSAFKGKLDSIAR